MAFRYFIAVLSVFAVASQSNAACFPAPPPTCALPAPAGISPCLASALTEPIAAAEAAIAAVPALAAASTAPSIPTEVAELLGKLLAAPAASAPVALPAPAILPAPVLPAPAVPLPAIPCPVGPTKVSNKPDVTIPLSLPSEIPVGKFCTCQKFAIKPSLVPCLPAPLQ